MRPNSEECQTQNARAALHRPTGVPHFFSGLNCQVHWHCGGAKTHSCSALRQCDPPPPDHSKWKHKSLISSRSLHPDAADADSVNAANSLSERLYQFGSRALTLQKDGRKGRKRSLREQLCKRSLSLSAKGASASDLPYREKV